MTTSSSVLAWRNPTDGARRAAVHGVGRVGGSQARRRRIYNSRGYESIRTMNRVCKTKKSSFKEAKSLKFEMKTS